VNGAPKPSWLDRFLGFVHPEEHQQQIGPVESNSGDIFRGPTENENRFAAADQNQPATGEGSQTNLDRRAAVAAAAAAREGDTSMPYTPGHATCNLFSQKAVAESGAPKPEVKKADGKMGAPSAAELAGDRVPPG